MASTLQIHFLLQCYCSQHIYVLHKYIDTDSCIFAYTYMHNCRILDFNVWNCGKLEIMEILEILNSENVYVCRQICVSCIYVLMNVCRQISMSVCLYQALMSLYVCIYVHLHSWKYECIYLCRQADIHESCMNILCMHVCNYVCIHVLSLLPCHFTHSWHACD